MKSNSLFETVVFGRYIILRSDARKGEETHNDEAQYMEMIQRRLFGGDARLEIIVERYIERQSLRPKIGVLDAHGYQDKSGNWCYQLHDQLQGEGHTVQSWIGEMDGLFGALYLHVCNPGMENIKSSQSLVVHPRMNLGRNLQEEHGLQMDWFAPGFGYIEPSDYRFEKFLNGATIKEAKSDRRSLSS